MDKQILDDEARRIFGLSQAAAMRVRAMVNGLVDAKPELDDTDMALVLIGIDFAFAVARAQDREIEFLRRELAALRASMAEDTPLSSVPDVRSWRNPAENTG